MAATQRITRSRHGQRLVVHFQSLRVDDTEENTKPPSHPSQGRFDAEEFIGLTADRVGFHVPRRRGSLDHASRARGRA
jgi:hypothetical protein